MVNIKNGDEINYKFLRSNYDCLMLDVNLESDYYERGITHDSLAFEGTEYYFNTILLYYSIYDTNNNLLATNLYGVYFIDSPVPLQDSINSDSGNIQSQAIKFQLPTLHKIKSTEDGFGTSYAFRLNMRTSSIYDDYNIKIDDNSSSENSIVGDFNNVVANLNKTINLLNKHVKNTDILVSKITELQSNNQVLQNKLIQQENLINQLLGKNDNSQYIENINTSNIGIGKFEIQNKDDNLIINDKDSNNIITFNDDSIILDKKIIANDRILYNYNNYNSENSSSSNPETNNDALINFYNNLDIKVNDSNTNKFSIYYNNENEKFDIISILSAILAKVKGII